MKSFFLFCFLLISQLTNAQSDTSRIHIPMKNGIVFYEKTYILDNSLKKDELYSRALLWFTTTFGDSEKTIKTSDKDAGTLIATGAFKVITSESGNYYWLKPVIDITVKDGNCIFRAYDYYEKPIEKGITNDYSKIEYRWWDFRKGKSWSSEDQRLFEGLDQNTLFLMASLEKTLTK
jgi:Domain of unknown function (DUF4468) with TBP-like fold